MKPCHLSQHEWEGVFDAIDDWVAIISPDSTILRSNRSVEKHFRTDVDTVIGMPCCKLIHGTREPVERCPIPKMRKTKKRESTEVELQDGRWMRITVDPVLNAKGEIHKMVHIVRDITGRVRCQTGKEHILSNLKATLDRIKTISGLIPICSKCKKIRDSKGRWNRIESYIEERSDTLFSHSLCPECSDQLYGDNDWYKNKG